MPYLTNCWYVEISVNKNVVFGHALGVFGDELLLFRKSVSNCEINIIYIYIYIHLKNVAADFK